MSANGGKKMNITNTDRLYTNPGFPLASTSKSRETVLAFTQLVQERREEMERRLHDGVSDEPSYQIGAASYTEREWGKLLQSFDTIEEEIRREIELEAERAEEEKAERELREKEKEEEELQKKALEDSGQDTEVCCADSLLADHFVCSCPETDGTGGEKRYHTIIDKNSMCCFDPDGNVVWKICFSDITQYETALDFFKNAESGDELIPACDENFWHGFLNNGGAK